MSRTELITCAAVMVGFTAAASAISMRNDPRKAAVSTEMANKMRGKTAEILQMRNRIPSLPPLAALLEAKEAHAMCTVMMDLFGEDQVATVTRIHLRPLQTELYAQFNALFSQFALAV